MADDDGLSRTPARAHPFSRAQRLSDVTPRQIEWAWEEWIPRGALTMVTGDPNAGKSTFICELLAAVSVGRALPGETGEKRAEVSWYLSGEDDAGAIVHWRIANQAGDATRILITDTVSPADPAAVRAIGQTVKREGVHIVVFDLTTTWLRFEEINQANKIADALTPLILMARETGCAVILLRHSRKDASGKDIHRGVGSVAFTGTVRAEILVSKTKDGQPFVKLIKGNYSGRVGETYGFRIEPSPQEGNRQGVFVWEDRLDDPVTGKTDGKPVSKTPAKLDAAKAWLAERLAAGPVRALEVLQEGAPLGFTERTLNRAKKEIGARSVQVGKGVWMWQTAEEQGPGT
jgi:hypothetical protein